MRLKDRNILLISNEPWSDIWLSKHHFAYALAKNNFVYFLNSPHKWDLKNAFTNKIKETQITDKLTVLSYFNFLPLTGKSSFLFHLNNRLVCNLLKNFFKEKKKRGLVFLSFDPVRLPDPKLLETNYSIYYCVDNHIHTERENILAKNVDMVLAVSEMLVTKLKTVNSNIHFLPHGIQENLMTTEQILTHKTQKEILYIGSVNYRLNYALLIDLANNIQDHTFKIVGTINKSLFSEEDHRNFDLCAQITNIQFTGGIAYFELQNMILNASACISFYKQDYISNMLNSLKILQYLSYGKAVVSNYFEVYKNIQKDILYMCADKEFLGTLKGLINHPEKDELKIARIDYARQFTYPKLIGQIEKFTEPALN